MTDDEKYAEEKAERVQQIRANIGTCIYTLRVNSQWLFRWYGGTPNGTAYGQLQDTAAGAQAADLEAKRKIDELQNFLLKVTEEEHRNSHR